MTIVYFYWFPKIFKSNVSNVHNGVVYTPTANPFANKIKWLGCGDKTTGLKEWHNFIRKVTFHLNKVGKDYDAIMGCITAPLHVDAQLVTMAVVHKTQ